MASLGFSAIATNVRTQMATGRLIGSIRSHLKRTAAEGPRYASRSMEPETRSFQAQSLQRSPLSHVTGPLQCYAGPDHL